MPPRNTRKVFRHAVGGVMHFQASYLTIPGAPEAYIVVYTPEGAEDRRALERLVAAPADHRESCVHRADG
ncbi:hypothetical protein [Kitasatospora sp. NPDC051914]|uniref:hypothetical protein n=1 Tax=Kitasatospora sp. NPDC051914 TaxID=3154945 RepID=UPI00342684AA